MMGFGMLLTVLTYFIDVAADAQVRKNNQAVVAETTKQSDHSTSDLKLIDVFKLSFIFWVLNISCLLMNGNILILCFILQSKLA